MNNWFKMAFGVGVGFTLGKFAGRFIEEVIGKTAEMGLKKLAKEGNEVAKTACEKRNINYESKKEEPEMKIGFHY